MSINSEVFSRRGMIGLLGVSAGAASVALIPERAAASTAPLPRPTEVYSVLEQGASSTAGDWTAAFQAAINTASANGGGIVFIPAGDYPLTKGTGEATLTLKSNVTIRGEGYASHVYLDPATPPDPARHYVMRVGSQTESASNIVVENIRLTVNHSSIGGGSLMGICARHDGPDKTIHSDNIYVRNCFIYDAQIAVGCTKSAVTGPYPDSRLNGQYRNWSVENCVLDLCGNKMIEFGECNFGFIRNNVMTRCTDGPQAIFHSRNILIEGNLISYRVSGINVTAGSNHITILGNVVEADPSISVTVTNPALYFRTEATASTDYVMRDVRSIGNVYRDRYTSTRRAFRTGTRPEVSSSAYERVSFIGDTFDGNVQLADLLAPSKTTIQDFTFVDCIFMGDIVNVASSTMVAEDVAFQGCDLRRAAGYTLAASKWTIQNSRVRGPLAIAATANDAVVEGNRLDAPLTGAGVPLAPDSSGNYVYG